MCLTSLSLKPRAPLRHVPLCLLLAAVLLSTHAEVSLDNFICKTTSCELYDNWEPVDFDNSTRICQEAQEDVLTSFAVQAPQMCRQFSSSGGFKWPDCRKNYCAMYENLLQKVLHLGGPGFYGEQCRPFLAFNRTLCERYYRDAEAFCDCFCPTMNWFEPASTCEADTMAFLLLGRRGIELANRYALGQYCATFVCKYFEKLGDPKPVIPVEGVPSACHKIDLPWRYGQCLQLLTRKPYNPSPWLVPTSTNNTLRCSDQTDHQVDDRQIDTWTVCTDHDFRWQCPRNYAVMCSDLDCIGSTDYCCQTQSALCRNGQTRQASVALSLDLPEWHGRLTPDAAAAAAASATTTTLDPVQVLLSMKESTTYEPSIGERVKPLLPFIISGMVCMGAASVVAICMLLGGQHVKKVSSTTLGTSRIFAFYHKDPVLVFAPSGEIPKHKCDEVTFPTVRPSWEIEAERLDNAAREGLEEAARAARQLGPNNLAAVPGAATPREAAPLRQAIAAVRERNLHHEPNNAELIRFGEQWLRTLDAERALSAALQEARPALNVVGKRMTTPPVSGQPWQATTMGRAAEGEIQRAAWHKVELLREALKVARTEGAYTVLVKQASELLADLVARTPELPADRCVLDPEGDGLKLLPMGSQRAVWLETGDTYIYQPESKTAGALGEPLPARELLGEVGVDEKRPVCADFAKRRSCRAGRRCPWRHCLPKAGDTIRECILFEDC